MSIIDIIVPVYNSERYLKETIDSILSQSFIDFDIICVDDGSTDSSLEIIQSLCAKDNRVRVIRGEHKGASVARNTGYYNSSSEYVLFFDADDIMLPNALESLLNAIGDKDLSIGFQIQKGQRMENCFVDQDILCSDSLEDLRFLLLRYFPNMNSKLIRRSFLEKHGIVWDNVNLAQDVNFFMKIVSVIDCIKVVNDYVAEYTENPSGISKEKTNRILGIKNSLDYVELFAKDNSANPIFMSLLPSLRIMHYNIQMDKCVSMSLKDSICISSELEKMLDDAYCDLKNNREGIGEAIYNHSEWECIEAKWKKDRFCSIKRMIYLPYAKIRDLFKRIRKA